MQSFVLWHRRFKSHSFGGGAFWLAKRLYLSICRSGCSAFCGKFFVFKNRGVIRRFLKKFLQEDKLEEPKKQIKKLTFDEVKDWVKNKDNELKNTEKELLISIKNKILTDIKNLEVRLESLEYYDFNRRKDKEKIEHIVK